MLHLESDAVVFDMNETIQYLELALDHIFDLSRELEGRYDRGEFCCHHVDNCVSCQRR